MKKNKITVLLVDDHQIVREGIAMLLSKYDDIDVIGSTGESEHAIELARTTMPNVVILDISMPGTTGYQLIGLIQATSPTTKILMLSVHACQEHVNAALGLGAHGYIAKSAATEELILALRTVQHGSVWIPTSISREVLNAYIEKEKKAQELTTRQAAALKMTVEGKRTKEIAFELGLSIKTVETYRTQIMTKLGIQDIPNLVKYAILNGLTDI